MYHTMCGGGTEVSDQVNVLVFHLCNRVFLCNVPDKNHVSSVISIWIMFQEESHTTDLGTYLTWIETRHYYMCCSRGRGTEASDQMNILSFHTFVTGFSCAWPKGYQLSPYDISFKRNRHMKYKVCHMSDMDRYNVSSVSWWNWVELSWGLRLVEWFDFSYFCNRISMWLWPKSWQVSQCDIWASRGVAWKQVGIYLTWLGAIFPVRGNEHEVSASDKMNALISYTFDPGLLSCAWPKSCQCQLSQYDTSFKRNHTNFHWAHV